MSTPFPAPGPSQPAEQARDLQARLYREIGISAVAAALRSIRQPEPGTPVPVIHPLPPVLREDQAA